MERKMPAAHLCLLLLLLLAPGPAVLVQGRDCMSRSTLFKGTCYSWRNCRYVCHNEGFPSGKCAGFIRRCYCVKPCSENSARRLLAGS